MNAATDNNNPKTITISADEYNELMAMKKAKDIADRRKKAGQNFYVRRQALVLRRVNQEEIAPDADVLAYDSIYELKKQDHEAKGTFEDKMKIPVSDEEIKDFLALEDEGHSYNEITLEMIRAQPSEDGTMEEDKEE